MTDRTDDDAALEQFHKSLDDIEEWFQDNDRADVTKGLLPGATPEALREAEIAAQGTFPRALRALYERHDGQSDRENHPFFGSLVFADLEYAHGLRRGMLFAYFGVRDGGVIDRSAIFCDPATPLLESEYDARWFPFANMGGDFLAVHLGSGRVFRAVKDLPALRLAAPSLSEFVARFADRLWNEQFKVDARGWIRVD